ncbi:MAG: hypothetical protein HY707_14555 [Ignavibacteriae bacterium]|nr:hypothetical protein [Ignavibacteriota bacterium]
MAQQDEGRKKGTFGSIRLAIAKKYIYPFSRRRMMFIGGLGCLAVLAYFLVNVLFQSSSFVIGKVSSSHAAFEMECDRCHQSFKAVSNAKCSICHEKTNDKLGVYTFAAHYRYRSGNIQQIAKGRMKYAAKEILCAGCHPEHTGREAMITKVSDARCTTCHDYGSFNKNHPQFAFARNQITDDSTLIFTHIRHTKFVLDKIKKVSREDACLYCHNPQPDGKHFKPLNFDVHCADCHLTTASETPLLNIKDPNTPTVPGVETLHMIQNRRGPGTLWAFYTNPNEFTEKGTRVSKSPVYHKDPWILENLKLIRQMLYNDLGLSDLLKSFGKVSMLKNEQLYREAIQTLQDYVTGLRSRPEVEVQADLTRIDSLLKIARLKIGDQSYNLSDSLFMLGKQMENVNLTAAQKQAFEGFALKLTKTCQECHVVAQAKILRVKSDQQVLNRAEFDHRAHILQRRCLECHIDIPVTNVLDGDTTKSLLLVDRSSTQNIPKIENCFQCHNQQEASNRCITCHYMHPNKENRANLQLFVAKD